jgi:four helix bundle protein
MNLNPNGMLDLKHKKLTVYTTGIELVKDIYQLTDSFPIDEKFSLVNQLKRSAVSVPSNIAEGASRNSRKERSRFFQIARSSLVELDTQIEVSMELNYVTQTEIREMKERVNHLFAMLSNMM